ncbi:DNA polymerase Y family protein [Hellea sp.]|nr:DNA polymerase Y family protein [Hellea sp.]
MLRSNHLTSKQRSFRPALQKRNLSVHLPCLPLDRWRRREDSRLCGPFAVTEKLSNAERILNMNSHAKAHGVVAGQSLTDAAALCPDLLSEPRDILRERHLLKALQRWADKFSPRVGIVSADGLSLDITGCAHLFGGEKGISRALFEGLRDLRVTPRIGIANTQRAARGFARFSGEDIFISDSSNEYKQVCALPVCALDMSAAIAQSVSRLGLRTIADLTAMKSSELARRFSVKLPTALDELRGHVIDPVIPAAAPKVFAAQMNLPDPIGLINDVTEVLRRLSERVCTRLADKAYGARGFTLTVRCVDSGDHHLTIGFANPTYDQASVMRQFARPIDSLLLKFGADWFRLEAINTEVFKPVQIAIGDDGARDEEAVDQTLTTLGNRLGFDRLRRPVACDSHAPEREHASEEVVNKRPKDLNANPYIHPRPELSYRPARISVTTPGRPPKAFSWKGANFITVISQGPERVSPLWWITQHDWLSENLRDYWRVKTVCGRKLWLMQCPQNPDLGWFCAGEFLR